MPSHFYTKKQFYLKQFNFAEVLSSMVKKHIFFSSNALNSKCSNSAN